MKRSSGLLALLAIVLAGFHYAGTPKAPSEASSAAPVEAARERGASDITTTCDAFSETPSEQKNSNAPDIGPGGKGEIATLVDRYFEQTSAPTPTLPAGIELMVAMVPDPVHTHLSLQFDRALEAIQQAAQDEKYTYDSSWLPWKNQSTEYAGLADQKLAAQEAARRELCPGIILFRRNMNLASPGACAPNGGQSRPAGTIYECGLLVFVVGEEPTSGMNVNQWLNALHWVHDHPQMDRRDRPLRILGPTFSGSMPSIVRAVDELGDNRSLFTSILLYSGRIRGCSSWRWLQTQLRATANPSPGLPVRIADFQENDSILIDRFYRYLEDRGHHISEVAILSEDETAYGGLPDASGPSTPSNPAAAADQAAVDQSGMVRATPASSCDPQYPSNDLPVHLYYPRDISAVRSAYQEQSIFTPDTTSEPHVVLRPESGSSAHHDTDTIEPFSGPNMALTQEAQLYGIVNTLRTHSIRFVVLRSTNSLDYLFLTRFLHRAYPAAYIVTMGTDLLFGREIDSTEFRGVIALSSYPLLPRGQDWTRQTDYLLQHAHRVFGSYTMEGDYLAMRYLITDPSPEPGEPQPYVHRNKADLPDYSPPFWNSSSRVWDSRNQVWYSNLKAAPFRQPSTWMAVIGRDGYWPLSVLTKLSIYSTKARFSNLAQIEKPKDDLTKLPVPNRLTLSSTWKFCCALAVLAVGIHFFACRFARHHQHLGICMQFTPMAGERGRALIALGWTVVCSMLFLIFMASLRLWSWLTGLDRAWVVLLGTAAIASCILAVITMQSWRVSNAPADQGKHPTGRIQARAADSSFGWVALMFALLIFFIAALWRIFGYWDPESDGVTIAYRSIYLTSGVAPVVSLMLMLTGLYWWFWQNLVGLSLHGGGRPVLPRKNCMNPGLGRISDDMAAEIEATAVPFPDPAGRNRWLYLFPMLLVIGQAAVLQKPWSQPLDLLLHSLENTSFNWTLHILFGIALYLVFLECAQLFSTWLLFRRLLLALNRLPLRRTFAALEGLSMGSLRGLSDTSSRVRYQIFSHLMESLLHLRNALQSFELRDCGNPAVRQALTAAWEQELSFVQKCNVGLDLAVVNDNDVRAARKAFSRCARQILTDLLIPAWLEESASLDLGQGEDGGGKKPPALSENRAVKGAEEFVCIFYVGYLQNLLARMRTMVLSMAGLFAAIALSVAFYPYTPRPTIALALTLLLGFIAAVVGVVYAGLDRDATLSHITNTKPGSLGAPFWIRIISFAGVPALSLIVAQFPEITDFVTSWIQPSLNAIK